MSSKAKLHQHQRIQDAYGNNGRILNLNLREGYARVRMDNKIVRDYDVNTIKPINKNG
jgi:hypothetical protein